MRYYAGVGSRKTPKEILDLMWRAAVMLRDQGWTARSGHSGDADMAFENGARAAAEIYQPWPGFKGRVVWAKFVKDRPDPEAFAIARDLHPNWSSCSTEARALHARNVHILCGPDAGKPDLARFMICWTPGARTMGGTGMSIRIAEYFGVEVYNLALAHHRARIENWTKEAA